MSKVSLLSLSDRDKTPAPSGWGHNFHHTNPQRRVPCVLGDMLAPLSADDIPPITPEAMASVQAAITLLAHLIGDRDHGLFLGADDAKLEEHYEEARNITLVARGLAGILRVATASPEASAPATTPSTPDLCARLTEDEVSALGMAYEHVRVHMAHQYPWVIRDTAMHAINYAYPVTAHEETNDG